MSPLRFGAIALALLTLYYARFFVFVRQESSTLVQIGILLVAAAILSLPLPIAVRGDGWFRHWRPISSLGWIIILGALGLGVLVFAWADHDSHSVSDTLNRSVPTLCLVAAVLLRLMSGLDERRRDGSGADERSFNPGGGHS